jgi:hypothetical protein
MIPAEAAESRPCRVGDLVRLGGVALGGDPRADPWSVLDLPATRKARQQGTWEPSRNLALPALVPGVPRPAGAIQATSRYEKKRGPCHE